ncbi:MAG TPA: 7-cyano-7-deazaguanine synthase QueC [Gammaproteobacteria bacterium]|jgi:7-cyano-7-deazaguanine synthase|nr:7-cyano-7-deazaguanine synthase QueC [Gammaproteobacteria bacterium]
MDSATVLADAAAQNMSLYALSFRYGQLHSAELDAAQKLAKSAEVQAHRIIDLDLAGIGGSALTDPDIAVPDTPSDGIPVTYVPARNTVFLSIALAWAEVLEAQNIYIGVNAVDYSGYPDCRPEYIAAFSTMANLATRSAVEGSKLTIQTPLLNLSKSEIIQKGIELGVDFSQTVSCYRANDKGEGCGVCDACRLRKTGFEEAGIIDKTRYYKPL